MKTIGNYIKCIPASDEPLSADVYLIEGEQYCYIFDVGNCRESLQIIREVQKEKIIILSHHHKDHTGNIDQLDYKKLYVGDVTAETIGTGIVVREPVFIRDGIDFEIIPCVSPHTGGSLIVNVNYEYTLIADLFFSRPPIDTKAARNMIQTLETVDTGFFVVSHRGEGSIYEKQNLISQLYDYFQV